MLGGEPGPLAGTLLSERAGEVLVVSAASLVATTLLAAMAAYVRASAVSRTTGRFRAAVLGILSAPERKGTFALRS